MPTSTMSTILHYQQNSYRPVMELNVFDVYLRFWIVPNTLNIYDLILLLLLKPAAQAQVGITKSFVNCFRNPASTCATGNWKTPLREASTVDCSLNSIQLLLCQTQCMEGYSTYELGPARNTLQIGSFYTLILRTSMDELRPQLAQVELWQKQMKPHWTNNVSSLN